MARIGRFDILRQLGDGGMGVVWLAQDPLLNRKVALKQLAVCTDEGLERFRIEAMAVGQLQHDNIVTVYEFGEDPPGRPFIAMEYIDGPSARELVVRDASLKVELSKKIDVICDVLAALEHAHGRGIYHRDIKPENIMMTGEGRGKLLDFGIAKLAQIDKTRTKVILGTLPYMSPEQVKGQELDGRTDIFSVGVVLYELLTGRRPFDGSDVYETMQRIICLPVQPLGPLRVHRSDVLSSIVETALEKERPMRYATAADMARALLRYRDTLITSARHPVLVENVSPRDIFERGKTLYVRRDFWRAADCFRQVLERIPSHPAALSNLKRSEQAWRSQHVAELETIGIQLWKRGDYRIAAKTFEELLELDPENAYANFLAPRCGARISGLSSELPLITLEQRVTPRTAPGLRAVLEAAVDEDPLVNHRDADKTEPHERFGEGYGEQDDKRRKRD